MARKFGNIEVFHENGSNSEIAASAREVVQISLANRQRYHLFNRLIVSNLGAIDTDLEIDGDTGNVMHLPQGSTVVVEPEDGIFYGLGFSILNLSSTTVVTAAKIRWRMAKVEGGIF